MAVTQYTMVQSGCMLSSGAQSANMGYLLAASAGLANSAHSDTGAVLPGSFVVPRSPAPIRFRGSKYASADPVRREF